MNNEIREHIKVHKKDASETHIYIGTKEVAGEMTIYLQTYPSMQNGHKGSKGKGEQAIKQPLMKKPDWHIHKDSL